MVILGKVPLFYYVLHLLLIHLLAVIVCAVKYGAVHWMMEIAIARSLSVHAPAELGI